MILIAFPIVAAVIVALTILVDTILDLFTD